MQHVKASAARLNPCFRRTTGLVTITQVTPTAQFIIKAVRSSEGLFIPEGALNTLLEKVIRTLKMMKAVLILVLGKFVSVSWPFFVDLLFCVIDAESYLDRLVGSDRETLAFLSDKISLGQTVRFIPIFSLFAREFLFPLAVFLSRFDYVELLFDQI